MLFLKIIDDKDQEMEIMNDDYESPIPEKFQWRNWAADDEGMTGDELLNFIDAPEGLFDTLRNLDVTGNERALMVREVFEGNNNYMKSGINIRKVVNKLNEVDFNKANERHLFGEIYETILKELQSAGDYGEFYTPRAVTQFMTDMINLKLGEMVLDSKKVFTGCEGETPLCCLQRLFLKWTARARQKSLKADSLWICRN